MIKIKKSLLSVLIALVLAITLVTLVGCSGLSGNAKTTIKNSTKNWQDAVEKTVTDTYTISNLRLAAMMGTVSMNLATLSATIEIKRTFTADSTAIEAKISVQSLEGILLGLIKGVTLNQSKANKIVINASIKLEDKDIKIDVTSKGLKEFVVQPVLESELKSNTVLSVAENPAIAALMKDSLDMFSVGDIPDNGEMYKDSKQYNYILPASDAMSEMSKQFGVIFDVIKEMSVDDSGNQIKGYVEQLFGTSNLSTILGKILKSYEMPIIVKFNDDKDKYYISETTTNGLISGKIQEAELRKLLELLNVSADIEGTVDLSKGISISTSNEFGMQLKSTYEITKFS